MGMIENTLLSLIKMRLNRALDLEHIPEISSAGIKEHRDIPYKNRAGKKLLMDIFEPETESGTELPVIINIHGGALIEGNKNFSVGFCRQLAKRGYLVFLWNIG